MKRDSSAGVLPASVIRSPAALKYASYWADVMPSALAVLSKLRPSSAKNALAGCALVPSRSRTVLLYSVLLRRWIGTRPGSVFPSSTGPPAMLVVPPEPWPEPPAPGWPLPSSMLDPHAAAANANSDRLNHELPDSRRFTDSRIFLAPRNDADCPLELADWFPLLSFRKRAHPLEKISKTT